MDPQVVKEYYEEFQGYRDNGGNIINFYEKRAKQYDEASATKSFEYVNTYVPETLKCFLKVECELKADEIRVLDLACGTGATGVGLKKAGFTNIDGADGSKAMLEIAQATKIYNTLIQGLLTDNERFDNISDGTYDGVVSVGGITANHITVQNAIPEFIRVLKTGGIAVYTVAPSVSKAEAMVEHAKYLEANRIEIVCVENKFYGKVGYGYQDTCHVYVIKKM